MLTAGVDLSAEDATSWLARIQWTAGAATVVDLQPNVANSTITDAARAVSKLGIDCPLGWPVPFVEFVVAHDQGKLPAPTGPALEWRRRLANRTTDLVVRDQTRDVRALIPLSVSADRIAHTAMRCAALLADFVSSGVAVDRTGRTGTIVEVYPAASLLRWKLTHRKYKGNANAEALSNLVNDLSLAAPWLNLGAYASTCRARDDAFDAVIAALSARAAIRGQTLAPTPDQALIAAREGWIALPLHGSLHRLVDSGQAG